MLAFVASKKDFSDFLRVRRDVCGFPGWRDFGDAPPKMAPATVGRIVSSGAVGTSSLAVGLKLRDEFAQKMRFEGWWDLVAAFRNYVAGDHDAAMRGAEPKAMPLSPPPEKPANGHADALTLTISLAELERRAAEARARGESEVAFTLPRGNVVRRLAAKKLDPKKKGRE